MTTTEFTPEQSLKLMEKTIKEARNRYYYNGFPLIFWGLLVSVTLLLNLSISNVEWKKYINIGMYFIGFIGTFAWVFQFRKNSALTKLDAKIGRLWAGHGLTMLAFFFSAKFGNHLGFYTPALLLVTAFTLYIMYFLIEFKPLFWASILFLIYGVFFYYTTQNVYGYLIGAAVMFVGYVIPGLLMWQRAKNLK